jgi:uncharacterized membrane protein YdjX (TVP38/TMEM64 family)
MTKQLEKNSTYAAFDTDGDGVVTDDELSKSERMIQIQNMDALADQQRVMAWVAMGLPFVTIMFLCLPYITDARVQLVMGLATTFAAAMGTIVVAFMAATAYIRGKMNDA